MTGEELKSLLAHGEGVDAEFKESTHQLARKIYESICAFLNRKGGHIVLGAKDDGRIVGIAPDSIQEQMDTLVKDMNNPQLFRPTYYLNFESIEVDGKLLIYCHVPESTQAHSYKNVYYDRNRDGDFELRSTEQIANLFIRKSKRKTEETVYPALGMDALEEEAFDFMRQIVRVDNAEHPWISMSNEEVLRSGQMIAVDPETGKEGLTLAAILLFGKRNTIASVLPMYFIDVLCRIHDTELYDDRLQVKENLMVAYRSIMEFIKKHLPEKPYIEGMQRFSLRDRILREVTLNLLIHREYSSSYPTTFTIFSDKVVTENWNVPYVYGKIDLTTLKPHRKNPLIANVFSQMGIVEELGSGTRKIFKYTPLISGGKEPMIEEEDVYKVTIPMEAGVQNEKLEWTKLWNQLGLSKGLSKGLSNEQIGLFFESLMKPVAASKLRVILGYTNATKFKNSYIVPLMEQGLVVMSQPDKPNSPTQKYYLTEKGKRVIGSVREEK